VCGLDALLTQRVHHALGQPMENTLHDVRWGDADASGTVDDYVWVLLISGAAPPAHFVGGWKGAHGYRQPAMYFPNGGSTLHGVSKSGEIIWSRIYVAEDALHMDIGRGGVVALAGGGDAAAAGGDDAAVADHACGDVWGESRSVDGEASGESHSGGLCERCDSGGRVLVAKAAFARALGIQVNVCGRRTRELEWKS
jgi:hypothetical protein